MVKPKKPEIGVWKTVESKGRHKHQKEKPKPVLGDLPVKSKKQNNDAIRLKHPKHSRSTPRQQFHDRNRQRIIFLIQCRFHHIGHLHICHTGLIIACLVFIRHGILIPICRLFLHICAQIILPIGSRQLVSHHLQKVVVLILKTGLCRKENTR